jgi:NAD(P)-dependent dehydrogenase (short-subunit alcohol dehydrogenase family)
VLRCGVTVRYCGAVLRSLRYCGRCDIAVVAEVRTARRRLDIQTSGFLSLINSSSSSFPVFDFSPHALHRTSTMPSWVIIGVSRGIGVRKPPLSHLIPTNKLQYQFLRTLSLDPSNTVIGIARTPAPVAAQVTSDALPNVHILPGDLTSYTSLAEAAALVAPLTGGVLDHLIINGVYHNLATLQLSPADYISKESMLISEVEKSMLTNALGPFFAIQAFMPLLLKGTVKKVVAISSAVADTEIVLQAGMGDGIPYAVSKAALNMLVAKCAVTYGKQGVKVLAINPGFVYTMGGGVEDSKFCFIFHFLYHFCFQSLSSLLQRYIMGDGMIIDALQCPKK